MAQKLHLTQDEHGFWMVSLEHEDGTLTLEVFQVVSRRHAIEDAGGSKKEMIPVGALVSAVDQVTGKQDEIDRRMTMVSGGEQTTPAFEACLGVAQVQEVYAGQAHRCGFDALPRLPAVCGAITQ